MSESDEYGDYGLSSSAIANSGGSDLAASTSTGNTSIGSTDLIHRDAGLQHDKERIYEDLANKQFPIEASDLILQRFQKNADGKVRATFFNGVRSPEPTEGAVEPMVGLTFMAGADAPQVNRMEQIGMTQGQPDQKTATWRVNTAGALLLNFDVDKDLSIVTSDNTSAVISRARTRRGPEDGPYYSSNKPPKALTSQRREDRTVTIDSDNVKIVNNLHTSRWDLESTLIAVDGSSLMALIVNYRHLISRAGPVLTFSDTVELLDVMIEDARRLCVRSPILFRMSTRRHIIVSKNTRYGIDHGTIFTTLTTSKGIRNIIELSASYFNTLASSGGKDKSQEMIRPKFLQMLVLLLSLLNDDDLRETATFLEVTYKLKADRQHIEILILKVLPLMSINSKIFMDALVQTFDNPELYVDPENQAWTWRNFIARLLHCQYILPGNVDQLGSREYSWIVKLPKDGIKDTYVFNNLQYGGEIRTFNDIPPIDLASDNAGAEVSVILTNSKKYIIGHSDLEKLTCMMRGRYSMIEAEGGRPFDLEVTEHVVNQTLFDAIHRMNRIIGDLNRFLAAPRRRSNVQNVLTRVTSIRIVPDRNREVSTFEEIKGCGRLTYSQAMMGEQRLAAAYKVEGRKITRRDLIRNLTSDLGKLTTTIQIVETAMHDYESRGAVAEARQHMFNLREALAVIRTQVTQVESSKARLERNTTEIQDEPVSKVLYPSGAERSANPIWEDYRAHVPTDGLLYIHAHTRYVQQRHWISDDIIEVAFHGIPMRYFVSPLRPVEELERYDELMENDRVYLVGQYVVVVEAAEPGYELLTNWLKITSVQQNTVSRRGANRRAQESFATAYIK